MTRRTAPSDPSERRRFTLLARVWALGLVVVAAALNSIGAYALAVGVIAIGLVGFVIVFDGRRPWWTSQPRATTVSRRMTLVGALVLILVTAAVISFQLGRS